MQQKIQFYTSKLKSKPEIVLSIIFVAVFAFLIVVPFAQMIYTTLTYQSYDLRLERGAEEGAFTFFHYKRMFGSDLSKSLFLKPFLNSIKVGVSVTLIAMFVGSILAWLFVRTDIPYKKFFQTIIVVPYMIPSWVIALAWQLFFQNTRTGGHAGVITAFSGWIFLTGSRMVLSLLLYVLHCITIPIHSFLCQGPCGQLTQNWKRQVLSGDFQESRY